MIKKLWQLKMPKKIKIPRNIFKKEPEKPILKKKLPKSAQKAINDANKEFKKKIWDKEYTIPKKKSGITVTNQRNINISRVITKITAGIITLYVGGTIMNEVGTVMNGTTSPFYQGLTLIGWQVNEAGTITDTTGSGILAVIGIMIIVSVVIEFFKVDLGEYY